MSNNLLKLAMLGLSSGFCASAQSAEGSPNSEVSSSIVAKETVVSSFSFHSCTWGNCRTSQDLDQFYSTQDKRILAAKDLT